MDTHALQVTNRELEAQIDALKRNVMQLEDRADREEAETRRLLHLISDKNEEIESLKSMVFNQKRENVELLEELQRHLATPAMASPNTDGVTHARIERGTQTLVDITPPEEVDRMHQQIEELQMQLEHFQTEMGDLGATYIRQSGYVDDDERSSNRDGRDSPDPAATTGSPNDDELATTISPLRKPPLLQLNLAIPPNLGAGSNDFGNDIVLTARGVGAPSDTPRAHIRIPPQALITSRGGGTRADQTFSSSSFAAASVPLTARRGEPSPYTSQTPRISTAELMRRSYIDPTSTSTGAGGNNTTAIVGDCDINYGEDSMSPKGTRQVSMSLLETQDSRKLRGYSVASSSSPSPTQAYLSHTSMAPREIVTDSSGGTENLNHAALHFRARQAAAAAAGGDRSPCGVDGGILNLNSTCTGVVSPSSRASGATAVEVDVTLGGGHMFGIEDAEGACPVCHLMDTIQATYAGRQLSKEAYYAVGWIPELCHRWSLEHNVVWTIEERAAVATALTNRTKLSAFTSFAHRGPVSIWRKRPFWRSAWRTAYAVLQGVFLYIFNSSAPNEPVVAVIPIRASFIELVTLNGRTRCLQISSLGCKSCVGASDGDCVETMTIALDSQRELLAWERALLTMQKTCAHKCSQKFMNELTALKDISEMLLTLAKKSDKRLAEQQGDAQAK